MKIVINTCFGGFGLSDKAMYRLAELKGLTLYPEINHGMTFYYIVPKDKRTPELQGNRVDYPESVLIAIFIFYQHI